MDKIIYIKKNLSGSQTSKIINYAFKKMGLNVKVVSQEIPPHKVVERFRLFLKDTSVKGILLGGNENEIYPHIDKLNDEARILHSAETIVITSDRKTIGINMEGSSFVEWLKTLIKRKLLRESKILILGAGPAGRAIARALSLEGCREIVIYSIGKEDRKLVHSISQNNKTPIYFIDGSKDFLGYLKKADVIINATGLIDQSPLPQTENLKRTLKGVDLSYLENTKFISDLKHRGLVAYDGKGYFITVNTNHFKFLLEGSGIISNMDVKSFRKCLQEYFKE